MNVSFNVSPGYTGQVGQTDQTQGSQESQKASKTLTITVTGGEGPGQTNGMGSITLSYPLIGPEDIDLNDGILGDVDRRNDHL